MQRNLKRWKLKVASFRDTGLKAAEEKCRALKSKVPYCSPETEKVIIHTSKRKIVRRGAVHILPICLSTLLIALCAVQILNGPQISTAASFFLQVGAKFHVCVFSLSFVVYGTNKVWVLVSLTTPEHRN